MLGKRVVEILKREGAHCGVSLLRVIAARLGFYCLLLGLSSPAWACPSAVFMQELQPRIVGPRDGMRLFVLPKGSKKNDWNEIAHEVDPVDVDGHLLFFKDEAWRTKDLAGTDFLLFDQGGFGRRITFKEESLPCKGSVVYELRDEGMTHFAYLTNCGAAPKTTPSFPSPVRFDAKQSVLESATYRYQFNPANYMQFGSIGFAKPGGGWEVAARDSRLLIRADVKNFFTMHFSSKEIESQMEDSRMGPMGDLARLSFFLRILVFKIRMSLSTDVGFFADSAHIPMMVSIPVDAYKHLNPASGILYSWLLSPAARAGKQDVKMPRLDPALIRKGWKELAGSGLAFCKKNECPFRYTVDFGGRRLAMDLTLERPLVERGFYPLFVEDVAKVQKEMGWEVDTPQDEPRIGMYFEVSGLPEGGHPWDFWMRLGGTKEAGCPAPFRFARIPESYLK